MGARDDDRRTGLLTAGAHLFAVGVAHFDDERFQALVVTVAFVGRALVALVGVALQVVMGQLGFDAVADLDDSEVGGALKNGARDQIAHALAELFVNALTGGLAHNRADDALGVLGGDAAHVVGRDVALFEVAVLARFRVGVALGDHFVHVDLARVAVDRDARIPFEVENVLIGLGQRCLQAVDEVELVDLSLVSKRLQRLNQL